jgi:hypothetical protein
MSNWSEPENICEYDVKLKNDGLNVDSCKIKLTEQF